MKQNYVIAFGILISVLALMILVYFLKILGKGFAVAFLFAVIILIIVGFFRRKISKSS